MDKKIKAFEYDGKKITFDFGDGAKMVNATEMAKAFGKPTGNFLRLRQTKDFIKALKNRYSDVNIGNVYKPLRVVKGGDRKDLQGTWMDEKLALKFAAWLHVDFELWVWDRIHELLSEGAILEMERMKKTENFYLNKMFDDSLQINRMSRELLQNRGELPPDE